MHLVKFHKECTVMVTVKLQYATQEVNYFCVLKNKFYMILLFLVSFLLGFGYVLDNPILLYKYLFIPDILGWPHHANTTVRTITCLCLLFLQRAYISGWLMLETQQPLAICSSQCLYSTTVLLQAIMKRVVQHYKYGKPNFGEAIHYL